MSAATLALLAAGHGTAPLAWHHGRPIGVAQFLADVAATAAALPAEGPAVNLCLNRYAFAVALGAALQRGQVSMLPPNARADTLAQLQQVHGARHALSDDAALQPPPGLPTAAVVTAATDASTDGATDGTTDGTTAGITATAADAATAAAAASLPAGVPADAALTCLLTSGSTGAPQPHAKSWRQWTVNVAAAAQRLAELLGRPSLQGLTLVSTVPPQHSYGFESSVLLALLGGASFETGRPFYPADIAAALAAVPAPRALVTTPFHLKALLAAGIELPATALVLSATAPLSPQLARLAEQRLGGQLIEIYGCTEAGQVASRRTALTDVWHAFGTLRLAAVPQPEAPGGEGFVVSGGHLVETTPLSDVLRLIDDQHFQLLGRANDLVHVAGKRSSLGHLNHHLNSIAGVDDGAFWLPDEVTDGVVRPIAFVVAPGLSGPQILAALRERLDPVFVPRRVVQVAALPREATGKLTLQALREFALRSLKAAQ
ncbi:AMP-binding protein [Aquabacterium sp. OR-4]|uniref:AMP-binding protein n=1 Tax=Aquabacterium sp. OR-4 TaxID=2978127 RepID=UPI0021B37973|nr:AMP-binding protein [Aquabacterium sp. OR-4]MDT7836739.1 AMP-binding protein [Aquabacterium sp. OR-4]